VLLNYNNISRPRVCLPSLALQPVIDLGSAVDPGPMQSAKSNLTHFKCRGTHLLIGVLVRLLASCMGRGQSAYAMCITCYIAASSSLSFLPEDAFYDI